MPKWRHRTQLPGAMACSRQRQEIGGWRRPTGFSRPESHGRLPEQLMASFGHRPASRKKRSTETRDVAGGSRFTRGVSRINRCFDLAAALIRTGLLFKPLQALWRLTQRFLRCLPPQRPGAASGRSTVTSLHSSGPSWRRTRCWRTERFYLARSDSSHHEIDVPSLSVHGPGSGRRSRAGPRTAAPA